MSTDALNIVTNALNIVTNALNSFGGLVGGINWEAIFQLTFVALIMISGPVVIFLLAVRGGDL
ncbi:MAG: photosystem II reaction center protein Ycf12 [Cyanobacteriota bacterium]|nr:photosystem II reaction center protein Ycf12 [Cyanobacteriota bacterium]